MSGLDLPIPEVLVERFAELVAERVAERIDLASAEPEPFIGSNEAAEFLGYRGRSSSKHMSELVTAGKLPRREDRNRLLFLKSELVAMVEGGASD